MRFILGDFVVLIMLVTNIIQLLLIHFILVVLVIFVILVMLVDCLTLKYRFMRMLINWYRTQANLQCKVCFI